MTIALSFALGLYAGMAMMLWAHKAWIRRTISTDGWTGAADTGCQAGWDAAMITVARLAEERRDIINLGGGSEMAFNITAMTAWDMVGVTPKMPGEP